VSKIRSEVGFWATVGRLKLSELFSVENISSVLLGAGLAWFLVVNASLEDRVRVAGLYLSVVAALVGIVFAGLALVASLLSEAYMALLRSGDTGVLGFFRPFMLAIGVQVATVLLSLTYCAVAKLISQSLEPWVFGVSSALFFSSCLEIVVLTRSVLMHTLLRSRLNQVVELHGERKRRASGE